MSHCYTSLQMSTSTLPPKLHWKKTSKKPEVPTQLEPVSLKCIPCGRRCSNCKNTGHTIRTCTHVQEEKLYNPKQNYKKSKGWKQRIGNPKGTGTDHIRYMQKKKSKCSGPPRVTLIKPRLPSTMHPKNTNSTWAEFFSITELEDGRWKSECKHNDCSCKTRSWIKLTKAKASQAAQQHAKKHFEYEYKCQHCNGLFELKTCLNAHYLTICEDCGKEIRVGNKFDHKCK